jgi:zinc transport system substrate-binding protein
MSRSSLGALWAFLATVLVVGTVNAAPAPRVVVSIQPLHSLVSAVMAGVGEPYLLIKGAGTPHGYSLTPADARALSQAAFVVWVGEALETALVKPLAALATKAVVLGASGADGVELLQEPDGESVDGHIWLDPRNARAIASAVAEVLARIDPANAARYTANAATLGWRLSDLETELAIMLAPVRAAPYVVYHDAYRYFERRFATNVVGSVTISPERAPGAKRITEIRTRLRETGATCVFREPQFEAAQARVVVEETKAKIAVLDPLGAGLPPGPDAYFAMMHAMARSLRDCLAAGS